MVCLSAPTRLDFTPEQIDHLIDRLNRKCLQEEDYPLLADLLRAIIWLNFSLQEKTLSIQRLRAIFGIKTETAAKLLEFAKGKAAAGRADASAAENFDSSPNKEKSQGKKKKPNHGHRPSSEYTNAKTIAIAHQALVKGNLCPSCQKGRLFNLSPGTIIHIIGQPWLKVEIYKPERLRCPVCGKIFTADLPQEVATSRANHTAKAIVSLLKYKGGVPFYRQEKLQESLGAPISASEIWEMTEDVADALQPAYAVMCEHAANADIVQNDDTMARVLSIMKERNDHEEKRKGIFTTGIIAKLKDAAVEIGLFFTGRNHAGENLDELLNGRSSGLPVPIQQCDGGHNVPENHDTQLSNCLAHARRKFYELVSVWPVIVTKVIGWFAQIFANDKFAPSDPEQRLKWHQEKSEPIMNQMKEYFRELLEKREVEPNSSLGKAIAYFNNHWEGLTLFLRVPGVPLTNNDTERLIKKAVLNRKNAYFYRTETGAKIGDILMSMIETCVLNQANPWDYLVAVQDYRKDVWQNPRDWMPWNFQIRLTKLRPP